LEKAERLSYAAPTLYLRMLHDAEGVGISDVSVLRFIASRV
jgi:hypothetical protein